MLRIKAGLICVLLVLLFRPPAASAQANVLVSFTTTNSKPLNLGFAGFTTELLSTGTEYGDTNMQRVAASLSPGWLLFPAGTTGDAFDWSTGLTSQTWINTILSNGNSSAATLCQDTYLPLIGKGGVWFTNFVGWPPIWAAPKASCASTDSRRMPILPARLRRPP